jgi:hypothetical protein
VTALPVEVPEVVEVVEAGVDNEVVLVTAVINDMVDGETGVGRKPWPRASSSSQSSTVTGSGPRSSCGGFSWRAASLGEMGGVWISAGNGLESGAGLVAVGMSDSGRRPSSMTGPGASAISNTLQQKL